MDEVPARIVGIYREMAKYGDEESIHYMLQILADTDIHYKDMKVHAGSILVGFVSEYSEIFSESLIIGEVVIISMELSYRESLSDDAWHINQIDRPQTFPSITLDTPPLSFSIACQLTLIGIIWKYRNKKIPEISDQQRPSLLDPQISNDP